MANGGERVAVLGLSDDDMRKRRLQLLQQVAEPAAAPAPSSSAMMIRTGRVRAQKRP